MTVQFHLAPAATGKTAYVLDLARDAARDLKSTPRIITPFHLQARAWRHRLAETGGAIGVRVLTFDRLYAECLNAAGQVYTELSEPVRYRLIRAIVDDLPLAHYAPLKARPGFIRVLEQLIAEFKAARIWPETFAQAVSALGEPRLRELAQIYTAYQARLQAHNWADRAGLGWLAVEALETRAPAIAQDWPLLVVDGFDNFTAVQLTLLKILAGRVGNMVVTLTGSDDGSTRPLVHRRFAETRRRLQHALGVQATPLPKQPHHSAPVLEHLETHLFHSKAARKDAAGALELVAAPDRAAEARAALRWLKARLIQDEMRPGQAALLARSITHYRPFITQIAAELGLPIRLADGLPLRHNPAIAALLDLLRLMLPQAKGDPTPALPRRLVIEAWRCPYMNWSALPEEGASDPIGIAPGDADDLDAVARWGRVIGGLDQWQRALDHLAARAEQAQDDDERGLAAGLPVAESARALRGKFHRFVRRLTPPAGERSYRDFVGWLEALIGPDPTLGSTHYPLPKEPSALQVVAQARDAPAMIAERDVAALQALKDVLRGLVWAEEALPSCKAVDFTRFYEELTGAVDASSYLMPVRPDREEILVADVIQARGVSFRAVAMLGLAEGEFPTTLHEDPFLRDADRQRLRDEFDLPLEPSTASAEAEFFYEAITRPRERLLLTRPRLADNGAPWQASPYWEEIRRLVQVTPQTLTSEHLPTPGKAASWPELMESLAAHSNYQEVRAWVEQTEPTRQTALDAAANLLLLRSHPPQEDHPPGPHDGDLSAMGATFAQHFGPRHTWSASRLETYRACPFSFFVGSVLRLEPRGEPAEGLDARQLGNIYHHILEEVYQDQAVDDPADLAQLLAALPTAAARVLDAAPEREGFRETAWWAQTREEIVQDVERSLTALAERRPGLVEGTRGEGTRGEGMRGDFAPYQHEAAFGLSGQPKLVVRDGDDEFRLRGFIDRVDRAPDGRVRVIDYKTAGPFKFGNRAVREGKKLQLPLYALGARDALNLGEPSDGFYWHVRHAEASAFTLAGFGPEEAMETAVEHAWEAIRAARRGHFVPHPPDDGCPSYCPAVGACWHYRPGFGIVQK